MKSIKFVILFLCVIYVFCYIIAGIYIQNIDTNKTIVIHDTVYIDKTVHPLKNLTVNSFKHIVALTESNDNYKAISKNYKYFGKYQISETNINLADYDVRYFMIDNEVQENVMDDLIYEYLFHCSSYINKYSGCHIFDLDIDLWTILYSCHCIGYPKTKRWLDKPCKNRLYYQLIKFNNIRINN